VGDGPRSKATGFKGVRELSSGRKRFTASLSIGCRTRHLGSFLSLAEARAAVAAAEETREAAKAKKAAKAEPV
jgi:hypothetical protein